MNSTSIDPSFQPLLSSMASHATISMSIFAGGILLTLIVLMALILYCVKVDRQTNRFYRLLFRFVSDADSSARNIDSPDAKGRLNPPVWCRTCNEMVDHVNKLCPHVGQKLYASSLQRRLYNIWHEQLLNRFQSIRRSAISNASAPPPPPNITIDLDELIKNGRQHSSIDRQPSAISFNIAETPYQTSTPDRLRPYSGIQQKRNSVLNRVQNAVQSWRNRRRQSAASSGVGSSIDSFDMDEVQEDQPANGVRRLVSQPRRWASDIIYGRKKAAPKIVRRPTPYIILHRCSPPHRPIDKATSTASNGHLRPDGSWTRHQHNVGITRGRSASELNGKNHQQRPNVHRSSSATITNVRSFPTCAYLHPSHNIDCPVIVHASTNGSPPMKDIAAIVVAGQEPQNDSLNCSFSDYL